MIPRLFCFVFLCLPVSVSATVFQVQSTDQQIGESDGIIIGHFLRKKSIKLDDGSIATQMIFKMNKELGMQSELFGMNEIIIHYPGGKIGEENVRVDGVPSFIPGESVALMIKSHQDRYWGLNLGMGSFKIINYGNETMLVNSVFPEDRRVSQHRLEDFERSVKRIKGLGLKVVASDVYPSELPAINSERLPASVGEKGQNRSIASTKDKEENGKELGFSNFWLMVFLAFLGGVFRLTRHKEAK